MQYDSTTRLPCKNLTESLFDPTQEAELVSICDPCPIINQCRAYAYDNKIEDGIWGGTTAKQRRWDFRPYCQRDCGAKADIGRSECANCQRIKAQANKNLANA